MATVREQINLFCATEEQIAAWAESLSPTDIVGTCKDFGACAVTEYLMAKIPTHAFQVFPERTTIGFVLSMPADEYVERSNRGMDKDEFCKYASKHPLPRPASQVALAFDALGIRGTEIDAGRLQRMFRERAV